MRLRSAMLAASLVVAGCGGDDAPVTSPPPSEVDVRNAVAALLIDVPLDDDGVACVVDAVVADADGETIDAMMQASSTDDLAKAQLDVITDAVVVCS